MKTKYLAISILLICALMVFLPQGKAVVPPPDGGYPGFTTAEGTNALNNLSTGVGNTGLGWYSLFTARTANLNTGVGAGSLTLNTGDNNTAVGAGALFIHNTGNANTATGAFALFSDTGGQVNTATGASAMFSNTTGSFNTANGLTALGANTTGSDNTAIGAQSMSSNIDGNENTAVGLNALLNNTSGNNNVALGRSAGAQQTTGSNSIYIGFNVQGSAAESNACYIGSIFGQTSTGAIPVVINANHKLGTVVSSSRFKKNIASMDRASEALFALRPVTFQYNQQIDPSGSSQLGLVAEEVEKVDPDLVVRDKEGKPYTVRYDQVNAMLLNEFLKEHHAFVKEQAKVADQQEQIDALKKELKEQRALIQRVNDKIEVSNSIAKVAKREP